jgi:hypothetical protein
MQDIMIDMETTDLVATSAILSFAAVQCDLTTGKIGDEYYRVVDLKTCLEKGLTLNAEVFYWWLQQSEFARQSVVDPNKATLDGFCLEFTQWLLQLNIGISYLEDRDKPKYMRLWGNGASFDNAILRHAFSKTDYDFKIPFWQDRDIRTVVGFYPKNLFEEWKMKNVRKGAHNALDDARYQVRYISHMMKDLGVTELH